MVEDKQVTCGVEGWKALVSHRGGLLLFVLARSVGGMSGLPLGVGSKWVLVCWVFARCFGSVK